MPELHNLLAIDLGAESGRAIIGTLDGEALSLSELHRFTNGPVRLPDGIHWGVLKLWTEHKKGITAGIAAGERTAVKKLDGIGLDTWGVDFALLDGQGSLLANLFHTWCLSKNIMGLWLMQECRRAWAHEDDDLSYDEITELVADARPFLAVIDPDDGVFLSPGGMLDRICAFCQRTGQPAPQTKGEIVRVALEGIAFKCCWVLEWLESVFGTRLEPIHIIGGGTKNHLLSRFTANCTGRTCISGPVEATAIGNILMQAIGLGCLDSLAEARAVVRASFTPEIYEPHNTPEWKEAYHRLLKVMESC